MISFQPFGDSGILINFEQQIDVDINSRVVALCNEIQKAEIDGIVFQIPAYCSLTIGFDHLRINYHDLLKKLKPLSKIINENTTSVAGRTLMIPVCYDDEYAMDMFELIQQSGLSRDEIIALHSDQFYRVFMLGFLPGFPYMGKLPLSIRSERRAVPRLKVPAGSVGLAGAQTGIYPSEAPGGWQIIGRTPLKIFNISDDLTFLFKAGDIVRFEPVSKASFVDISDDIKKNTFNWNDIYV